MKDFDFESALSTYIHEFLDLKRAMGYKYDVNAYLLRRFDQY